MEPALSHQASDMKLSKVMSDEERQAYGIIYPRMPDRDLLNTFRDLRNKLLRLSDHNNFVCLLTALHDDGDTAQLAMNLAAVFAFDRSRSALIVDCDERVSILDDISINNGNVGLIDFIESDSMDMSQVLNESGIERVRIIPSGSHTETRTESLESVRMRDILLELKSRYTDRYIFINAPNMRFSSEVQILSNVSDLVVFQVDAGTVADKEVEDAIKMIGEDKVAGIVFNGT